MDGYYSYNQRDYMIESLTNGSSASQNTGVAKRWEEQLKKDLGGDVKIIVESGNSVSWYYHALVRRVVTYNGYLNVSYYREGYSHMKKTIKLKGEIWTKNL